MLKKGALALAVLLSLALWAQAQSGSSNSGSSGSTSSTSGSSNYMSQMGDAYAQLGYQCYANCFNYCYDSYQHNHDGYIYWGCLYSYYCQVFCYWGHQNWSTSASTSNTMMTYGSYYGYYCWLCCYYHWLYYQSSDVDCNYCCYYAYVGYLCCQYAVNYSGQNQTGAKSSSGS